MTRTEAEALRNDPQHWRLGVVYRCKRDPRVIVRNLFVFGWTWNFGHKLVAPAILAAVFVFLAPTYLLAATGNLTAVALLIVATLSLTVILMAAHHIASGPREH